MHSCYEQDGFKLEIEESEKYDGTINITVNLSGPFIGVRNNNKKVTLFAAYEPARKRIWIEDIQGNGYYSGIYGKGTGKLLVNTLLQIAVNKYSSDLDVKGMLSEVGDPVESPLKEQTAAHREKFWESFGFKVIDGPRDQRHICSKLGDLRCNRSETLIEGVFPNFVELIRFRETQ